jgi:arylsulfatase A-like enzyme
MLTPTYGIGDGFSHYDYTVLNDGHPHDIETSNKLTDLALRGARGLQEPWFVWVHYFDPHFEYLSHPAFAKWGASDLDRYDGEIAHTDHHIGRLLNALDGKNTVVVFTSDHGEEFGEHGGKYHYTLFDEVMRTPLVIKAPGLTPAQSNALVDQVDLLPTMLSLLGVDAPDALPGRVLVAPDGAGPPENKPLFIERDRPPPWRQQGVIVGNHKLFVVEAIDINDIPPGSRGTEVPVEHIEPGIFLYDLAVDPG